MCTQHTIAFVYIIMPSVTPWDKSRYSYYTALCSCVRYSNTSTIVTSALKLLIRIIRRYLCVYTYNNSEVFIFYSRIDELRFYKCLFFPTRFYYNIIIILDSRRYLPLPIIYYISKNTVCLYTFTICEFFRKALFSCTNTISFLYNCIIGNHGIPAFSLIHV